MHACSKPPDNKGIFYFPLCCKYSRSIRHLKKAVTKCLGKKKKKKRAKSRFSAEQCRWEMLPDNVEPTGAAESKEGTARQQAAADVCWTMHNEWSLLHRASQCS